MGREFHTQTGVHRGGGDFQTVGLTLVVAQLGGLVARSRGAQRNIYVYGEDGITISLLPA